MSKNRLKILLQDLAQEGLIIQRNKIQVFVPDPRYPGLADRMKTDFLKDRVFRKLPTGWSGFQDKNGSWVISGRIGLFSSFNG